MLVADSVAACGLCNLQLVIIIMPALISALASEHRKTADLQRPDQGGSVSYVPILQPRTSWWAHNRYQSKLCVCQERDTPVLRVQMYLPK